MPFCRCIVVSEPSNYLSTNYNSVNFSSGSLSSVNKNAMATFAPYYVDPVFKKEKLNALIETVDPTTLSTASVKPPLPYESSSELYDEIVG